MDEPRSQGELPPAPARWRARMFALSWTSYFSYYFTRKNYSVAKSSLGLDKDDLKNIDTIYLAAYAAGQFINGFLADVVGPRRLLAGGMMLSAILALVFSAGDALALYAIAFGLNGLVQSSGWPGNGRLMASWFSSRERGEVMGYWGTCYQVGGLAATAFATFLLARWGWRAAFIGPALWVAVVALAIWIWARDRPSDVGFRDPDVASGLTAAQRKLLRRQAWPQVLRNPMTWFLGANYFCMKLMRYSLLFWLPYYLNQGLGYGKAESGYLSMSFEAGGVIGVIASGLAADRLFGRRRIAVAASMTAMLAGALALYGAVGEQSMLLNFLSMMLVGALLFGPDALVSGAVAQDLGGPYAAALGCGVINGLGSLGAILQGYVTYYISEHYGWDALFVVFQALAIMATLALLPFFRVRPPRSD
jgi:sugar phosphate permease